MEQGGENKAGGDDQGAAPDKAAQGPAMLPRPLVLGHEDGDGLAAADAKGLGEVLHPGGGGEGGDGGGGGETDAVHRALDHQLAQIQAGLLEGGHGGIAAGAVDEDGVHAHVGPVDGQKGPFFADIDKAQPGGQQLGRGGGQGCAQNPQF